MPYKGCESRNKIWNGYKVKIPEKLSEQETDASFNNYLGINELNKLYSRLLRSIATLSEGGLFARRQYATQSKIQDTLVEIFDYFKGQISKKHGLIRQNLLGKSVDFGTRTVISAPNYNNENFEDNMISVEYTAVPISECCSTFYPFIESWVKNFFTREVINDPNKFMFYEYIDRPGGIKQVREVTGIR